jgi:hypothetical protein
MTNAEQTIADLRVALPAAETELAAAKKAEASARHELARFEAGCLAREKSEGSRSDRCFDCRLLCCLRPMV